MTRKELSVSGHNLLPENLLVVQSSLLNFSSFCSMRPHHAHSSFNFPFSSIFIIELSCSTRFKIDCCTAFHSSEPASTRISSKTPTSPPTCSRSVQKLVLTFSTSRPGRYTENRGWFVWRISQDLCFCLQGIHGPPVRLQEEAQGIKCRPGFCTTTTP